MISFRFQKFRPCLSIFKGLQTGQEKKLPIHGFSSEGYPVYPAKINAHFYGMFLKPICATRIVLAWMIRILMKNWKLYGYWWRIGSYAEKEKEEEKSFLSTIILQILCSTTSTGSQTSCSTNKIMSYVFKSFIWGIISSTWKTDRPTNLCYLKIFCPISNYSLWATWRAKTVWSCFWRGCIDCNKAKGSLKLYQQN